MTSLHLNNVEVTVAEVQYNNRKNLPLPVYIKASVTVVTGGRAMKGRNAGTVAKSTFVRPGSW